MFIGFLMTLFVILCVLLVLFILIQQGKGDMGLGGISRGSQMLFGGSGGQDFFEKATWTMGALFMIGALFITIMASKQAIRTRLSDYQAPLSQATQQTVNTENIQDRD